MKTHHLNRLDEKRLTLWRDAMDMVEREEFANACDLIGDEGPATSFEFLVTGLIRSGLDGADQRRAKDFITRSATVGVGHEAARANTFLALCYWRAGETQEALAYSHTAVEGGLEGYDLLCALFQRGAILTSNGQLKEALECLSRCVGLFDHVSFVMQGKVRNQLALVFRRLGKLGDAAKEYEDAAFLFEAAETHALEAVAVNNVAVLHLAQKSYARAHANAERAITLFTRLGDWRLGSALDTRAQIEMAWGKLKAAERSASLAVARLHGERPDLWAEATITHGRALARLGRHLEARAALEKAATQCESLGDRARAGDGYAALLEEVPLDYRDSLLCFLKADEMCADRGRILALGIKVSKVIEPSLIKSALQAADRSVTKAAKLLDIHHSLLLARIEKYSELSAYRKPARVRRWKKKPYRAVTPDRVRV